MLSPDIAIDHLTQIINDFRLITPSEINLLSETDTRVKLIDEILKNVCGWPENHITREEHVESGYLDYCLSINKKKTVVVEAKKAGKSFLIPTTTYRKLKINGTLSTDKNINEAILQVRQYCDDRAVRYAIATNGYTWIVFRAIREDMPWRDGLAFVFRDLEDIKHNFTDFWNLLSYDSICQGSLDAIFNSSIYTKRNLHRVLDTLLYPNQPLLRNRLNAHLSPIIKYFFDDIAGLNDIDILNNCYVYMKSLEVTIRDMDLIIHDSIPEQLKNEGTESVVVTSRFDSGVLGDSIKEQIYHKKGEMFLLLGGIGSGKTTLLKRYQQTIGKRLLDDRTIWFHVDFLPAPLESNKMELFTWNIILKQFRNRYIDKNYEARQNIKSAFSDKLRILKETVLKPLVKNSEKYESTISAYLERWAEDVADYTPRLLRQVGSSSGKRIILFIDNVDQLPPENQAMIFLLAQKISSELNSLTIISLREESYFSPNVQKIFTAYVNRKFHIASPSFLALINKRLRTALYELSANSRYKNTKSIVIPSLSLYKEDLYDFLKVVQQSIFTKNKNIAKFVDSICFGNMRLALEMFSTFLCSGAISVDKILKIYRRSGTYYVAFHEWLKSIMLGDRFYYKESQSPIMNIFDCGAYNNSSHFTALRILRYLQMFRTQKSEVGEGFLEIGTTSAFFEEIFDNRQDFLETLKKMVKYQLVELETKSTTDISSANYMRLTSSGYYYINYLVNSFCYLDLVLQDTPLNHQNICDNLRLSVQKVNNLYDKDDEKLERVLARFQRTEIFLDYLEKEEHDETIRYKLSSFDNTLNYQFMKQIKKEYYDERNSIAERINRNIETLFSEPQ